MLCGRIEGLGSGAGGGRGDERAPCLALFLLLSPLALIKLALYSFLMPLFAFSLQAAPSPKLFDVLEAVGRLCHGFAPSSPDASSGLLGVPIIPSTANVRSGLGLVLCLVAR